jgi:nucleoside-diphosphate-sugar epimerase
MQERDHRMTADGVFVTGATGFIGRHLVLGLLERGFRVFALTRAGNTGLEFLARAARTSLTAGFIRANALGPQKGDRALERAGDLFP